MKGIKYGKLKMKPDTSKEVMDVLLLIQASMRPNGYVYMRAVKINKL